MLKQSFQTFSIVLALGLIFVSAVAVANGDIVIQVVSGQNEDAFKAGETAAKSLKKAMGNAPIHAVIMAECFEEESLKKEALRGVTSVLPPNIVFGFSTYGTFSQSGCLDLDSLSLVGIGGSGIAVSAALKPELGIGGLTMEDDAALVEKRLKEAGATLAKELSGAKDAKLVIVMADAHSPKNAFLVQGVQSVLGPKFPITGGSANKNAGQTFVYYRGKMYTDAAIALALSGDFSVAMAGRQAKTNEAVIASATDAVTEASAQASGTPIAAFAYNCAGRKGKLDRLEDELKAITDVIGTDLPLFGCYCAGEIGPADTTDADPAVLSSGVGWHLMYTVLSKE